jgi:DNA polymerase-3 subunit delta
MKTPPSPWSAWTPGPIPSLTSVPFFTYRRLVVIRNIDALTAAQQKELLPTLESAPPGVFVLLVAKPAEGRAKAAPVCADLRKLLEAQGQLREFRTPYERDLARWVQDLARERQKLLRRPAPEALVARAGRDMARLELEVEKLCAYVGDRGEITADDVAAAVPATQEASVFDLVDAIGARQLDHALGLVPSLVPPTNPQSAILGLLGMLARHFRLLWQARFVMDEGHSLRRLDRLPPALAELLPQEHNLPDSVRGRQFLLDRYAAQAQNFSEEGFLFAFERLAELDTALKGQTEERLEPRLALELLLADLCTGPTAEAEARR